MDRVVHFEIPAEDVARAEKFYREVFEWQITSLPSMRYTMINTGPTDQDGGGPREAGFINGGMFKRTEPVVNPVVTINVVSIEDAGKKIEQNGGALVRGKKQVGEAGYSAYFKDSEGNVLGLWEALKKS